jgi:hypothetical protein
MKIHRRELSADVIARLLARGPLDSRQLVERVGVGIKYLYEVLHKHPYKFESFGRSELNKNATMWRLKDAE